MTDDPWKKPDPNAPKPPPPPPQYPPQQYPRQYPPHRSTPRLWAASGLRPPPGYGPPGGYAPRRLRRRSTTRTIPTARRCRSAEASSGWSGFCRRSGCWCSAAAGSASTSSPTTLTKNADEVNAFLRNVRDHQFTTAYDQLCPGVRRVDRAESDFASHLQAAVDRGHGVTSFDINRRRTRRRHGWSSPYGRRQGRLR